MYEENEQEDYCDSREGEVGEEKSGPNKWRGLGSGPCRGVSTKPKGGGSQGVDLPVMLKSSPFEPGNVIPVLLI